MSIFRAHAISIRAAIWRNATVFRLMGMSLRVGETAA